MLLYKYFSRFLLRFLLYLSIKKFSNVNKLLFLRKPFSSKILFRFWIEDEFFFFKWSYSQRCFDVAQRVVSTWLNVVNFNVDVHNVVSTLIWHCVTSRRHINLKTMLKRRWNVCWVRSCSLAVNYLHKKAPSWMFKRVLNTPLTDGVTIPGAYLKPTRSSMMEISCKNI